jgi:hypothetical protein
VTIGGVINHPKVSSKYNGWGDNFFWVIVVGLFGKLTTIDMGWVMSEKQFWVIMGGMVEVQFFQVNLGWGFFASLI